MPDLPQFQTLWSGLRLPDPTGAAARAVYGELKTRYGEPHRKYHNFVHIDYCLNLLARHQKLCADPSLTAAAIWFHDSIYDTHAGDNEEQSAALADRLLPLAAGSAQTVHQLILDTKHHDAPETPDGRLLADIDLSGIGGSSASFAEGCAQIRAEYHWVPVETYKTNRARFLRNLLARPAIYYTAEFKAQCESPARRNLQEELDRLARM